MREKEKGVHIYRTYIRVAQRRNVKNKMRCKKNAIRSV